MRTFFVLVEERKRFLDALPLSFHPVLVLHGCLAVSRTEEEQYTAETLSRTFAYAEPPGSLGLLEQTGSRYMNRGSPTFFALAEGFCRSKTKSVTFPHGEM